MRIVRNKMNVQCVPTIQLCTRFLRVLTALHSSLPFEHLGQSSLCVNQVVFFLFYFIPGAEAPGVLQIYSAFIF